MSKDSSTRSPGILRCLCWLPLVALAGIELYVRDFEGWGAWAAAPLLLVPALLSLPIAVVGLVQCVEAARARAPLGAPLLCTLVSAIPILWLGVRRFLT